MRKLLVICGPTATSKTELAIKLAKKFNGEIVSADSRQVYKGMDIGTGKDLPQNAKLKIKNEKLGIGFYEFEKIPVWMLDVVKPNQEFSVAHYVDLAWKVIGDIWQRGKLPIIVGGTGFYIKGVVDGIGTLGVPPDWGLRLHLGKLSAQELFEMLARINSEKAASMNTSDRANPRRLIRAIEVALGEMSNKKQFSIFNFQFSILMIGLTAPFKTLYQRIDKRIEKQIKIGAEKEVKNLIGRGYSWDLPAMSGMGYRHWKSYFEGQLSLKEMVQEWKFDEHAYARRQMTWFKKALRQAQGNWFDISKQKWENKIEKLVSSWYTKT